MSKTYLSLQDWNRKEHFDFFNQMDQPFFGISTNVDCTKAYHTCKTEGFSFFLYYLHKTLQAVNGIDNFRYRIEDNEVAVFDTIHASSTIGRPDHTFGFSFIPYKEHYADFEKEGLNEVKRVQAESGLCLGEGARRTDVIHFSSIPWVSFHAISHAFDSGYKSSVPKISVGKLLKEKENILLPVSVYAHHALMDGYHTGLFFDHLGELLR